METPRSDSRQTINALLLLSPCVLLVLLVSTLSDRGPQAESLETSPACAVGIEELVRLDCLPALKRSTHLGTVSSYDRSGGNDDGFSGKYSFVSKEDGGLVIADLKGPGVIYRIWTPTPTDDLVEFYFDGEEEPRVRIRFREIFLGTVSPFLAPLSGYGAGGFYSYTPLPFAGSCKIVVRAERVQFYQIHYALYPADTPLSTFVPEPTGREHDLRMKAREIFAKTGTDISAHVAPPGAEVSVASVAGALRPGRSLTLFESETGGRIVGIRISPASALAGKARDVLLRITFDGDKKPAVSCPAGDFFGYSWGEPAVKSLFLGTSDDVSYCYFPMPYDRSAKVELVSESVSGKPISLNARVLHVSAPRRENEGRFYALWRRENPTTIGKPYTFLETEGQGHIVGCVLQSQGFESGKTLFFEGDDQTTIDGDLTIHGTGSEDFFNGGWYDVPDRWEQRISFPLSGCLGYQKHLGRTGGYRFLIGDAFAYRESILQTIEHGGTGNSIPTDYCSVTYFYSSGRPSADLSPPPVDGRRVVDFEKVIFPAWWQIPIRAFPFNKATLTRNGERLGAEDVKFLSLRASGQDWFGAPFLQVTCDIPVKGEYVVSIEAVQGPEQGVVQLFRNEAPVGDAVDLYAETRKKSAPLALGTLPLESGDNHLMLKLVRKNEKSSGLGLDLVHVICERKDG